MNNITLNWSTEDRLRIDKLIGLLEQVVTVAEAKGIVERVIVDEPLDDQVPGQLKFPETGVVPARCENCKHLTVHNSPTLYAYCEKTRYSFEPFQTDTRTHFCSFCELAETPQEAPEPVEQVQTPQEPENAQDEPQAAETEAPAPTVSKQDILQKVIALCGAGKKAEAKDIITTYADSVSDLPDSALAEVWDKLTALEG